MTSFLSYSFHALMYISLDNSVSVCLQPRLPECPLQSVHVGSDHCSSVSATYTDIHVSLPRGHVGSQLPRRPCDAGSLLTGSCDDTVHSAESAGFRSRMIQKQIAINRRVANLVAKRDFSRTYVTQLKGLEREKI
jgi:hypothetical protein